MRFRSILTTAGAVAVLAVGGAAILHTRHTERSSRRTIGHETDSPLLRPITGADSVGMGPPETCAVWLDNVDRETFRRHARKIAGNNIHAYRTGKDLVE